MKIRVNTQECLYIEINGWTYYIDDSTNEQIMEKWMNTSNTNYKFNKKFTDGSFFNSLPCRVKNSLIWGSYSNSEIDFLNLSESEGIDYIIKNIGYNGKLYRLKGFGKKSASDIKKCLKAWEESHQEEITQRDIDSFNADPVEFEEAFENDTIERDNNE